MNMNSRIMYSICLFVASILQNSATAFKCDAASLNVLAAIQTTHHCIVSPSTTRILYSAANKFCEDFFPDHQSRLATGEVLEKWQAIKDLKTTTNTWHWMHMEQNSTEHLVDWIWIMPNNSEIPIEPRFFEGHNIDRYDYFAPTRMAGKLRYESANNQTVFSDGGNLGKQQSICEIDLPDSKAMSIVEEQVYKLETVCHNQLNGIGIGSSCFYVPDNLGNKSSYQECVDTAESTKVQGTYQHLAIIYTQEILNKISAIMQENDKYWIGLKNVVGGASHWTTDKILDASNGLRETDRPQLIGADVPATFECSTFHANEAGHLIQKLDPCDSRQSCLIERGLHAQRYDVHLNQRYLSQTYSVLNTFNGLNDEQRCAMACDRQLGCLAFNYNQALGGTCELLSTKHSTAADTGTLNTALADWNYHERID